MKGIKKRNLLIGKRLKEVSLVKVFKEKTLKEKIIMILFRNMTLK